MKVYLCFRTWLDDRKADVITRVFSNEKAASEYCDWADSVFTECVHYVIDELVLNC